MSNLREGEKLFAEGKLEEAETYFFSVLARESNNKTAHNNLGVIAFQKGDVEKAIDFLTKALKIDPFYKDAILNCSHVLKALDNLPGAIPLLEKGLNKYPDDEELKRFLNKAYSTHQRSDNAISYTECKGGGISRSSALISNGGDTKASKKEQEMVNVNTKAYWDDVYLQEVGKNEWRRNVVGFGKIKTYLGTRAIKSDTILDIGCGYGLMLDELKSLNCNLIGWDISEIAVKHIREKGYSARFLDFTSYEPGEDEKYDHVLASEFLEHVENPISIMRKMYELAKETIIITVPNGCLPHEKCEEHLQCFDVENMKAVVEGFDFKNIYIEEYLEEFIHTKTDGKTLAVRRPSLLAILGK